MARKNLLDTLNLIEKRIYSNSKAFRALVSDRKAHSITVDKKDLIFQVSAEMRFRLGVKELPDEMKQVIERQVTVMCRKFYTALHPKKFNTVRKSYETTGLKGTAVSFSIVYAAKTVTDTTNVFKRFKTIKQQIQKPLLQALNKEIESLNKGKRKGNRFSNINAKGAGFLDIGHGDDSSVSLQRQQEVNKALFNFDTSNSPLAHKFLGELRDNLGLKGSRVNGRNSDTISISLESKNINRDSFSKGEVAGLNKAIKAEIEKLGGQYWVDQEGSDSKATKVEKEIVDAFVSNLKGVKKKVKRAKKGPIKKANTSGVKSKERKPKASVGAAFKDTSAAKTKTRKLNKKGLASTPLQLIGIMNQRLPQEVRENMQTPALVNRTGRFADSVKITDINSTAKGFASVGYTYDRDNYGQYESTSGSRWADPDRDPRMLIDRSIREIAATAALGRFFTRRV